MSLFLDIIILYLGRLSLRQLVQDCVSLIQIISIEFVIDLTSLYYVYYVYYVYYPYRV